VSAVFLPIHRPACPYKRSPAIFQPGPGRGQGQNINGRIYMGPRGLFLRPSDS
jgi:hypothetical protein